MPICRRMSVTLTFLIVAAAVAAYMLFGSRLLLACYLRELRGLNVPPALDDAIITYPLA